MSYASIASAAASIIGGYLSGKGQKQKTYIPRRATKNMERDRLAAMEQSLFGASRRQPGGGLPGSMEDLYTNPENWPEYGPRPFSDPNPYELAGIEQLGGFATTAFPEIYQRYADTAFQGLEGQGGVGDYTQSFRDVLPRLQQFFGGGAPQIGDVPNVGFNPSVELRGQQMLPEELGGWRPGVSPTVTADANPTLERFLSGNADVQGLSGAVDAYLQPIMERFNSQVLPGLQRADAAATGGQSSAGALKASQRVLEGVGSDVNRYTQGLLYDASQRGLDRAGTAANLVTQARQQDQSQRLAAEGLAQQGLFGSRGFDLDAFRTGLSADQLRLLAATGNADRRLEAGMQNARFQGQYGDQLLDAARLGAGSAEAGGRLQATWANMMPALISAGMEGPRALTLAGTGLRGLLDPYAQYASNAYTYNANLPYQMGDRWTEILRGLSPQTAAPAQANQGSGGNVGAGLAGMLAMWPSGTSTGGAPAAMGSGAGTTSTFNPSLAGINMGSSGSTIPTMFGGSS